MPYMAEGAFGKMTIRPFLPCDIDEVIRLFHDAVHSVCIGDYTEAELEAWAPAVMDKERLLISLNRNHTLVMVNDGVLIGFADIDATGYFDHLFVHKDFQRMGVATVLSEEIEMWYDGDISVHASKTARPFFEKRGYSVLRAESLELRGEILSYYVMEKKRNTESIDKDSL